MLALLSPGVGPKLRASLSRRYGCQVSADASLRACDEVAARLESSVPPAQMAEFERFRKASMKTQFSAHFTIPRRDVHTLCDNRPVGTVEVLDREMYTEAEAARLLGVRQPTLNYWLEGKTYRGRTYEPVIRERPSGKNQ
jgi:hypothetical protein